MDAASSADLRPGGRDRDVDDPDRRRRLGDRAAGRQITVPSWRIVNLGITTILSRIT